MNFNMKEQRSKDVRGRTHFAVGTAAALLICQPGTVKEFLMGAGIAATGALISDIDVGTSESHKKADLIVNSCILGIAALTAAQFLGYINLEHFKEVMLKSNMIHAAVGFVILLALSAFGKECPHRGFMHSFLACAAFSWCINKMMPAFSTYFFIGFLSHLILDFLNKRGLQLFFPWDKRFCLKLCLADGMVDRMLCFAGGAGICIAVICFLFFR